MKITESTILEVAREELVRFREIATDEERVLLQTAHFKLNRRLTKAAGRASARQGHVSFGKVELSPKIFLDPKNAEVFEEELRDTVRHELAHLLAGVDAGHGPAWAALAPRFGFVPSPKAVHLRRSVNRRRFLILCAKCDRHLATKRQARRPSAWVARRRSGCCTATLKIEDGGSF
jgi:predicted SprT family Zn-dependent metalloprotease